jgi:hypothetical protein
LPTDRASVKEELHPALPQIAQEYADFVVPTPQCDREPTRINSDFQKALGNLASGSPSMRLKIFISPQPFLRHVE